MVRAVIGEKTFQIDVIYAVLVWLEANRPQQGLVQDTTDEFCVMNAAQINEVQCAPSENEQCFKIAGALYGRKVMNLSALCRQLELRDSAELSVHLGGISQQVGIISDAATAADILLLLLGLNGKYL